MAPRALKALTLNLWNRSGRWPERLRLITRELAELAPDVVGLQEVMRLVRPGHVEPLSPEHDQAAEVAGELGYAIAYAPAADYGKGLVMGNAILSRFPIIESRSEPLPHAGTGEPRSLGYALVATEWGELPVFVTHFNWRFEHGFARLAQAIYVAGRVDELAPPQAGYLPPILLGDFNAAPEADEIRFLTGLSVQNGRSAYFADAWVYGGDGGPGATFDPRNDYARANREPARRIDYIFVRGPDSELRGEPLHTKIVFNEPQEGPEGILWPSDHFGVYSEIAVEPRSL